MTRHRHHALRAASLLGFGPWIAALMFMMGLTILGPRVPSENVFTREVVACVTIGIILCMIFVVPFTWLKVWHQVTVAKAIRRSLESGRVDLYRGPINGRDPTGQALPVLKKIGRLGVGSDDVHRID